MFGVKENNYLGKGVSVNSNITINEETVKGIVSVYNPNYKILTNRFIQMFNQ